MKAAASLAILVIGLSVPPAGAQTARFSGVQNDVPLSALTGWTLCYQDLYSDHMVVGDVLSRCSGKLLMLACRPTGSSNLQVMAEAPREDVTFDTGTGSVPHNANGVGWYFNDDWSWGFAPEGAAIYRGSCDTLFSEADQRLCWHTQASHGAGWRCGGDAHLDFSPAFERLVFEADPCGDGIVQPDEDCDAGTGNGTAASCCSATCTLLAPGESCDDGDACTQTDTCDDAGTCSGADPVTCTALDPCHEPGTCDPATGTCDDPVKAEGAACDDANACTRTDTCDGAGACVGADPVTCTALDQCHEPGTCDPATGTCDDPAKTDGAACDDEDVCTLGETCQAGTCSGSPTLMSPLADPDQTVACVLQTVSSLP